MANASTSPAGQAFGGRLLSIGRRLFHVLFPNDVEYYLITLELSTREDGRIIDTFTFPITPSSIDESFTSNTSVRKTVSGITVLHNNTFQMYNITLSGSFGVDLKFMSSRGIIPLTGFLQTGVLNTTVPQERRDLERQFGREFNRIVKTGYGAIRVLEKMVHFSRQFDDKNAAFVLRYYNNISGNHFIVIVNSFTKNMDENQNFIWNYTLNMTAVAYADDEAFGTVASRMRATRAIAGLGTELLDNTANNVFQAI